MEALRYLLVDVFSERPFSGNPLAVFPDAGELPGSLMPRIAAELNLSETTFVLPSGRPDCAARVRIFTPRAELPTAGHPTLGTAFVLAALGHLGPGRCLLEEGVGPVPVELREDEGRLRAVMDSPTPELGPVFDDRGAIAQLLGADPEALHPRLPVRAVSCGLPYLLVPFASLDAVRSLRPAFERFDAVLAEAGAGQVYAFCLEGASPDAAVHARMFAPGLGVPEDPATGSAAGPLGAYLFRYAVLGAGERLELEVEQGLELGRPSRLRVEVEGTRPGDPEEAALRVRVGGHCARIGEGRLDAAVLEEAAAAPPLRA